MLSRSIFPLLADGRIDELGGHIRQGASFNLFHLGVLAIAMAGLGIGIWIISRWVNRGQDGGYRNPRAIFRELCSAHELDYSSRRLLKSLARAQNLDNAAYVFLQPDRFDPRLLPPRLASQRDRLQTIRDRIFGRSLADTESTKA
ncbi:hypothetical protein [Lignipirellula cremea]|nr:hypothetical protein [Lignipirellula cremea]